MEENLLDVRGLICPLPVLKANKALRGLPPGGRLVVLATDPASARDFPAYCAETGHLLLGSSEAEGVFRFELQRRAEPA